MYAEFTKAKYVQIYIFSTFFWYLFSIKDFFSGEIYTPGFTPSPPKNTQPKQSPKKIGRPQKSFEKSKRSGQFIQASQVAKKCSLRLLAKAASIKSGQEGLKNAKHIFKKLEKDPENKAYHYRQEEKAAKKKCRWSKVFLSNEWKVWRWKECK